MTGIFSSLSENTCDEKIKRNGRLLAFDAFSSKNVDNDFEKKYFDSLNCGLLKNVTLLTLYLQCVSGSLTWLLHFGFRPKVFFATAPVISKKYYKLLKWSKVTGK